MVKKIRNKFIKIAMLSMILVLFGLISIINIVNYSQIITEADNTLNLLAENNGDFPDMHHVLGPNDNNSRQNNASGVTSQLGGTGPREGLEKPFSTRFFTVTFSKSGKVESVNTDKIAAISEDDAITLATSIYNKKSTAGIESEYKYKTIKIGTSTMYIFLDIADNLSTFKKFLFASVGISVVGIILVYILVYYLSKMVIKPMLESAEKQKQFITDASHELKTPLSIIRANNDVITLENGESEWTKSTAHQIDRLNSLTEKLVFLSRMDEENLEQFDMKDFDLSLALEDTVSGYDSLAKEKNIEINNSIEENIHIVGDEALIRRSISLLLDNAIKYSNLDGKINVSLSGTKHPILSIENTVEEISIGDHSEYFDRFYRSDKSRNSKTGGFGIGLSVVKAIVNAHKAEIKCESKTNTEIIFSIIF